MVKGIRPLFSDDKPSSREFTRLFGRTFTPAQEENWVFRIFGGLRRRR